MKDCTICQEIERKDNIIYEDSLCVALLHPAPTTPGHIIIAPKKHQPILEQTDSEVVEQCFFVANKTATLVFEGLKVPGTNITVNNGVAAGQIVPHFTINVLPRRENDGIDFNAKRTQAKPEQLANVASTLKDCTMLIGHEKPKIPLEEPKEETITDDGDNYLIKQLRRIP